jgi:hypothetical protein
MVVHHNLFILQKGEVQTWLYRSKNRYELLSCDGREFYVLHESLPSFWEWWKESIGFVDSDALDALLLADNSYDSASFIPEEFKLAGESIWKLADVENILGIIFDNAKIRLQEGEMTQDYFVVDMRKNQPPNAIFTIQSYPPQVLLEKNSYHDEAQPVQKVLPKTGGDLTDYFRDLSDEINKKLR